MARRRLLAAAGGAIVVMRAGGGHATDALSDSRFVGFAQTVNDFEIASGRLALARSSSANIRGFANRTIGDYGNAAEQLGKARAEAGVSFAPDPSQPPNTAAILQQLGALHGADFDAAYAHAQLTVHDEAARQYGAYAQSGQGGPLRRYAERVFPMVRDNFDRARLLAGGR
ncbi:MAG: DUF4142 domain-containing protein [Enhydrobacter sp.]|nr:MAG: DUF4142 domain-containing protein [Enhydrobacter sp.]